MTNSTAANLERWERAEAIAADPWPELAGAILANGGIAAGPYDRDRIPAGVYRAGGIAPDEMAQLLARAEDGRIGWAGGITWTADDGTDAMLDALWRAYDAHKRLRERPARPVKLERGQRRLDDHLLRLEARYGAELDLSLIDAAPADIKAAYESGEQLPLEVGGLARKATIGCTSGKRPEFLYLLSLPVMGGAVD